PEEVQRPAKITQQEANGEKVEKYRKLADHAVFRNAVLPVGDRDGNLADTGAAAQRQHRNEPLQLAIDRDIGNQGPAVGLEASTPIVNADASNPGQYPVSQAVGNTLQPSFLAPDAAAANNIEAFFQFVREARDVGGIVL